MIATTGKPASVSHPIPTGLSQVSLQRSRDANQYYAEWTQICVGNRFAAQLQENRIAMSGIVVAVLQYPGPPGWHQLPTTSGLAGRKANWPRIGESGPRRAPPVDVMIIRSDPQPSLPKLSLNALLAMLKKPEVTLITVKAPPTIASTEVRKSYHFF